MRREIGFAASILLMCYGARGQDAPINSRFEVASVRPSGPGGLPSMRGGPGSAYNPDRITYEKVPLKRVLLKAYDVRDFQISGPAWIDAERFDITANLPGRTSSEAFKIMLQNLLADRFGLVLHHEKREFPIFTLIVAKGGAKLKVSQSVGTREKPTYMAVTSVAEGAHATAVGIPISSLALMLEQQLGGFEVVDKTGLMATYDFTLEFAPQSGALRDAALRKSGLASADEFSFPGILTAIQEQLGLKLERGRAPYDLLVIERLNKIPTDN